MARAVIANILGARGPKGDVGPATSLSVRSVKTIEAGLPASATVSGASPNQVIDFEIPKGDKGVKGDAGPVGPPSAKSDLIQVLRSTNAKVRRNLLNNPSCETANGTVGVRANRAVNPRLGIDATNWASNWFGGGSNTGTTERTADSKLGGFGMKKTWTVVGSNSYETSVNYIHDGIVGGKTYSFSTKIWGNCAMPVSLGISWHDSTGAELTANRMRQTEILLTPNGDLITLKAENLVAPAGAVRATLLTGHNTGNIAYTYNVGDFIVVGKALVTEGPVAFPYGDGSYGASPNLIGTEQAWPIGGSSSLTQNVSYLGDTWTRFNGGRGNGVRQTVPNGVLVNGREYTASWEVTNDGVEPIAVQIDWCDENPQPQFVVEPGERRRLTITNSRFAYDNTYRFCDLTILKPTTNLLFRDVRIEEASRSDFVWGWSGTPDNSASILTAPKVANTFGDPFAYGIQSSAYSSSRSKSLRIVPVADSDSTDTFVDISGMLVENIKPETTYTLGGTIRLQKPIGIYPMGSEANGTLLRFRVNVGTELDIFYASSPLNYGGEYRVVGRFTTGADATMNFIRLYSGAKAVEQIAVMWDELTLEEGVTDGSPFDGSQSNAIWEGSSDNSASLSVSMRTGPKWVRPFFQGAWSDLGGWQEVRFHRDDDGYVHLSGLANHGVGNAAGTAILIFPEGYRPKKSTIFTAIADGTMARLDLRSDGSLVYDSPGTGSLGYVSLEGIQFLAEV